jgi:hypothetical protein
MRSYLVGVVCLFSVACGSVDVGNSDAGTGTIGYLAQREVWSRQDAPFIFDLNLERRFAMLPDAGSAKVAPWAGNYWPTYQDNINHRWAGETSESPSKKYEKAFGLTGVEDAVSRFHGIDSMMNAKQCAASTDCDSSLGEECAKRTGATTGRCVATWFGICHAWAPAAILVPEPLHPVTKNGVTFQVQDLKALGTLVYNQTQSRFVSLRCNKNEGKGQVSYDRYGRPSNDTRGNFGNVNCRDTNPGTYHLLLANFLGLRGQSFVEDRTYDYQVWNQPLRAYRVIETKPVDFAQANALVGANAVGGTSILQNATVKAKEWSHFGPFAVTEGSFATGILKGTGDAELFFGFDAQPTDTVNACASTGSGSNERCELQVPAGKTQLFVSVLGYDETSTVSLELITGGAAPTSYVFNSTAASFVHVKAEVDYISESNASEDGNLSASIDRYTRTDSYEYVLELDAEGRIVGGEWVGHSKKDHPDFVWLPTGPGTSSVAGGKITFREVKALLDESIR